MNLFKILFLAFFLSFSATAEMLWMPVSARGPILSREFPKTPEGQKCKKTIQEAISFCRKSYAAKMAKDASIARTGAAAGNGANATVLAGIYGSSVNQSQQALNVVSADCKMAYAAYEQTCKEAKETLQRRIDLGDQQQKEFGTNDLKSLRRLEKDTEAYFAQINSDISAESMGHAQNFNGAAETAAQASGTGSGTGSNSNTETSDPSGPKTLNDCLSGAWKCDTNTLNTLASKQYSTPSSNASSIQSSPQPTKSLFNTYYNPESTSQKPATFEERDALLKGQNPQLYNALPNPEKPAATVTAPKKPGKINMSMGF